MPEKTNILSIETSAESCSAAIHTPDKVYARHQIVQHEHSNIILNMIDELLIEAKFKLHNIDVFAFGAGPGSFTGLRIAAGIVQGLSFASNKLVVPILTLQALAQSGYKRFGYTEIFAALDARMHQIYYNFFKLDSEGIMQPCMSTKVAEPDSLKNLPAEYKIKVWHAIGTGAILYYKELEAVLPYMLIEPEIIYPSALEVGSLAIKSINKMAIKPEEALPIYIRDEVANLPLII